MKTISNEITGDITVIEHTTYHNILLENVTVEKEVIARFYGIIYKDITVKEGAVAYIHGRVYGKVRSEGGTVYVFSPNGNVESFDSKMQSCKTNHTRNSDPNTRVSN